MAEQQRRMHFRLTYPENDRPHAVIEGVKYRLVNVSEGGLLLSLTDAEKISRSPNAKGAPLFEQAFVTGVIDFGDRAQVRISGYVFIVRDESFVVRLQETIPLSVMMSEQRFVIRKTKKPDDV